MTTTTTPTSGMAIQRYKIGYHADEWSQRSSTPSGIPDASGSWVRYADHVTALAAGQATAAQEVVPADQDDSLHLCASDLQHSAIYDNHVEMQSCMRAVAERITALASAPAQPTRDLEAVIKAAADKLNAAVCCHPNAVDTLIHEALEILDGDSEPAAAPAQAVAILFEHEDGRYAVNPNTTGDPAWHRLGPVDISALAFVPAQPASSDAYEGAREDLSIWKRRALEAERDLRAEKAAAARLVAELNAKNGPTRMGEPATPLAYGATEYGWTDHRRLEDGDKRLMALIVSLYGNDHQSSSDLEGLLGRAFRAAPAQPVAEQGAAYAALPTRSHTGRVYEEGFLIGTCPLYTADQMRAFADATYALRASHGQAPASVLHLVHSAFAEIAMAFPKAFALHKVGIADTAVREALAAPATQQAHQQEAQEPAAVVVPCHTPSGKRVALYSAKQDLPIGTQLYTAPQPSPTAQAADSVTAPPPPPECETEAEKRAFAFGWFKALESERMKADSVLEDALSDAVRVPLDSLHADAAYLIGRLRDGSMPYVRVIEIIRERIDAAKAAIRARAARAPADSVQEDAARLDWLLLRISGAEFRRLGVHYSGNARRADVDAARKQGDNHGR